MWLLRLFTFLQRNIQIIGAYENWAVIKAPNNNFLCSYFDEEVIRDSALSFWPASFQRDFTCGSKERFCSVLNLKSFSKLVLGMDTFSSITWLSDFSRKRTYLSELVFMELLMKHFDKIFYDCSKPILIMCMPLRFD